MEKLQVQATVPERKDKDGKVIQKAIGAFIVTVTTGSTAKEMIEVFGDEAVKSNANANWAIALGNAMRTGMRKGETQEQIQKRLGGSKLGIKVTGLKIDTRQAYLAEFLGETPEGQAKMLKELQARAAQKK